MQGRTNETCWIRNTQVKLAKFGNKAYLLKEGWQRVRSDRGKFCLPHSHTHLRPTLDTRRVFKTPTYTRTQRGVGYPWGSL